MRWKVDREFNKDALDKLKTKELDIAENENLEPKLVYKKPVYENMTPTQQEKYKLAKKLLDNI